MKLFKILVKNYYKDYRENLIKKNYNKKIKINKIKIFLEIFKKYLKKL